MIPMIELRKVIMPAVRDQINQIQLKSSFNESNVDFSLATEENG